LTPSERTAALADMKIFHVKKKITAAGVVQMTK
jgi:hypothetical protein